MRLPQESQLSKEQREVMFAKAEGTTVVVGPPGSGKTVIAIFRARNMKERGKTVESLVYNRVLSVFTETDSTFYVWLGRWWKKVTGSTHPKIFIPGQWRPPDFVAMKNQVVGDGKSDFRSKGRWGHLIIDEAQDFPNECHAFLSSLQNVTFHGLGKEATSLMILADENQRLTDENSTIGEILAIHLKDGDDAYPLRKNYRNTQEIAKLASRFYVGLQTGIPELPEERQGQKPRSTTTADVDEAVSKIKTYVKNHDNEEIGVLVQYDNTRQKLYNKLKHHLPNAVRVQTFSGTKKHRGKYPAGDLVFDKKGVVTVLCFASSKGLEFDAVFLPELQTLRVDASNSDVAKMTLYVMCSRARTYLELMVSDEKGEAAIWEYLPKKTDDVLTFSSRG